MSHPLPPEVSPCIPPQHSDPMEKPDLYEILLLRACKSNHPDIPVRLKSIFSRRCDASRSIINDFHIAEWLVSFLVKHSIVTDYVKFIMSLNESQDWLFTTDRKKSYKNNNERIAYRCISTIRLCPVKDLPEYPSPTRHKNTMALQKQMAMV